MTTQWYTKLCSNRRVYEMNDGGLYTLLSILKKGVQASAIKKGLLAVMRMPHAI